MNGLSARGIVFLLPTELSGQRGPVAGWLNTAGWVAAATRLGLEPSVITPFGVTNPESLRDRAFQQTVTSSSSKASRLKLPIPLKVALKDIREAIRARRFAHLVNRSRLSNEQIAFVWQRHELFQRAGRHLADRLDCPFVLYVTAPKVWEGRSWGIRRPGWEGVVERLGDVAPLQAADLVACVSEQVAAAVTHLGIERKRIIVTPSTVDIDLFRPGIDGSRVRSRYALEGKFVVGWTGSFRPFHGLDLLLDAIQIARRQVPELVAVFAGDGPERARLEAKTRDRGLHEDFRFTGNIPQGELPELLSVFDVAVVSARADHSFHYSPLKVWEYFASGVPVVAPSIGSLESTLTNGVDGLLVPAGDTNSFAAAITSLAGDPFLRSRLARAGRIKAESCSWAHQLAQITERLALEERAIAEDRP